MTAGAIAVPTIVPLRAPVPGQHKTAIDTSTPIELRSDTPGVVIFYTTNGSKPEPYQTTGPGARNTYKYTEPFRLASGKRTVKALACSQDGLRESLVVTKAFEVTATDNDRASQRDESLAFVNDIPGDENAKRDVKKFAHKMVTSKEAWAELQRLKQTENMMNDMAAVGSHRRRPAAGTRYMTERFKPDRNTVGAHGDLQVTDFDGRLLSSAPKVVPPDDATQAMRLQRETDFLKCIYCFAPRPSDPFARFCGECGNPVPPLPQGRIAPPEPGQMCTCVHCKSVVPFSSPNCLVCEAPIGPQSQPQASVRLQEKRLCTSCGTANPATLTYCVTCENRLTGTPKTNVGVTAAPPVTKDSGRMLSCTKCGRVNNPDARFCDWCGAKPVPPTSNLLCSKCGAANHTYARFCSHCACLLSAPSRPEAPSQSLSFNLSNLGTGGGSNTAQWLPMSPAGGPVAKCDMSTQTVGLFFPSQQEIVKKEKEEEEKIAMEKQMRDRKPLMTAISPGRGYWRKQMEHICTHLKAHAQNNPEFRALIGEPRMGKIVSTAVHEDGYELSLTVNFALRATQDQFTGERYGAAHDDMAIRGLRSGRASSLRSYGSQDSLASSTMVSGRKSSARRRKRSAKGKRKPKADSKEASLTTEDKGLLKEVSDVRGDVEEVRKLLEEGADPNVANKEDMPALHLAVKNKLADVVAVLCEEGAEVNKQGPSAVKGNTALHEAVMLGNRGLDIMDILLSNGANPQRKNHKEQTAHDLAVANSYEAAGNKLAAKMGQTALDKLIKPRASMTADDVF